MVYQEATGRILGEEEPSQCERERKREVREDKESVVWLMVMLNVTEENKPYSCGEYSAK